MRHVRIRTLVFGRQVSSVLRPDKPHSLVMVRSQTGIGQTTLDGQRVPDVDADDHRVDDDGRQGDHVIRHRVDVALLVGAVFHFAADDSWDRKQIALRRLTTAILSFHYLSKIG